MIYMYTGRLLSITASPTELLACLPIVGYTEYTLSSGGYIYIPGRSI